MAHIVNPLDKPTVKSNMALIRELTGGVDVKLAVILGSGLEALTDMLADKKYLSYKQLQEFPQTTVSGHSGELVFGYLHDIPVLALKGREHHYERGDTQAMSIPLRSLKAVGVDTVVLTNAAGSTRHEMKPGSVMLITDHIYFSTHKPLTGEQGDNRFVDMTEAYDSSYLSHMREVALKAGIAVHEGVYMWFAGPSFETPAEARAARILGADAVGMSTAPETIIARHCGLKVAGISVITSMGAGMEASTPSHEQTLAMAAKAVENVKILIAGLALQFKLPLKADMNRYGDNA